QAGGWLAGAGTILPRCDHPRPGAQRVAEVHRSQQDEPTVEEIATHPLGGPGALTDGEVRDQVRVRVRLSAARHREAELVIERQPQAVAAKRLVPRRMARRERKRWRVREDLPDFEILEVGTTDSHSFAVHPSC